ncbi:CgeB family protein [Aquibaculum arenosum]|uniref:Glycosyltransferase n=1 Tax=Aquibaculum arenosum TaxID=3032591 RepID=A0ABT5YKG5_9PROT|nr:glycosyltransferase [Fodinicurvata sp. CAU 1616]MDF2095358.1 glycosyltransferase [Fodinicurvata sp. CAU 1616]
MRIAFYGSSLLSSYWNGAATYYRGLIKALAALGHDVTFFEPDAFERQSHADIAPPSWCRVVVYPPDMTGVRSVAARAGEADVVVKASGVGVLDDELLLAVMAGAAPGALRLWWDVDAPATLAELEQRPDAPLLRLLPRLDGVLTYGGGTGVVAAYREFGAKHCEPVYNALDPDSHHPVTPAPRYNADLSFLGNRLPDRETRVESFLLEPARQAPHLSFLLGGAGWDSKELPENVRALGHVPTAEHNAFNASPRAVLNINRDSMAARGFSPPTRIFEAAGAGACVVTDAWPGIEDFLRPDDEVLVVRNGQELLECLNALTSDRAAAIGQAALQRLLRSHTYAQRARQVDELLATLADQAASAPVA